MTFDLQLLLSNRLSETERAAVRGPAWVSCSINVVFLCFISCLRHHRRSHVAMATQPHPAGNPRAHHPDPTLQAHAGLRILRHRHV